MGILDDDVRRVREATDLVALAGEHLALKRVGRSVHGLCPFHTEKSPSFTISPDKQVFYCLAGETRVLTANGARPIRELAGGVHRVLTTGSRWVDAPFSSFGVQPLMKIELTRNHHKKVLYATPEHRWFVRSGLGANACAERITMTLRPGDRMWWTYPQASLHRIGELSSFGIAHGITYGAGSLCKRSANVELRDKKAELLKWFPLSRSYQGGYDDRDGGRSAYLKVIDLPRYFKDRPALDESPGYLAGWLAGYFAANGDVAADGAVSLQPAERSKLEFVRDVCTRLGVGSYRITAQNRTGIDGRHTDPHRVHLLGADLTEDFFLLAEHRRRFAESRRAVPSREWVVRSVEATERVEEVYCAVVDETHAFTLEDNILTGNCFGCQKSGDAITFIRELEHLDFVEAVERLAGRAGITLRYDDAAFSNDRKRKQRLQETVAEAISFYHQLLLGSEAAGTARRYLRSRGFDGDVARRFSLGWSPESFDAVSLHLHKHSFSRDDIVDAGLAFVNKANRLQDSFRSRVMFPIWDARGEPVGFGGRALDAQGPKYKNTADTVLYQKSRLLYGLHWAKGEIVARGEVVICEGYTDVMAFALAGVPNAVATCGTALADEHFLTLKNLARKVILAYDADGAGQAAAERCYQWEQRYEVQFQVADLEAGRDPADVWRSDPQALVSSVKGATPFLEFRIERLLAAGDLSTFEGRALAGERAAAMIVEHPSDLVRDQYVMRLADRLDISPDRLRAAVTTARTRPHTEPAQRSQPPTAAVVDRRELDALRWAVQAPELMSGRLHANLFADPIAREAFDALTSWPWHECLEKASPQVAALLQRLAVEEPDEGVEADERVVRVVVNLVEASSRRLQASMLRENNPRVSEVKSLLDALANARADEHWNAAERSAEQLVTWTTELTEQREARDNDDRDS
ncbi:MAG: DNA primase [Acidimicrobiia bacterium]